MYKLKANMDTYKTDELKALDCLQWATSAFYFKMMTWGRETL